MAAGGAGRARRQRLMVSCQVLMVASRSAGDFWKDMMAEQIADAVSKQGGFGIAEKLFSQSVQHARGTAPNAKTDEGDRQMAVGMITDFQRQILSPSENAGAAKKSN